MFEQTLERVRRWYGFCVFGYVVMPEHVHLLVSEPEGTVEIESEWTARRRERMGMFPTITRRSDAYYCPTLRQNRAQGWATCRGPTKLLGS